MNDLSCTKFYFYWSFWKIATPFSSLNGTDYKYEHFVYYSQTLADITEEEK
jgi:hypothetical protein